jgi:hypothetical protein
MKRLADYLIASFGSADEEVLAADDVNAYPDRESLGLLRRVKSSG